MTSATKASSALAHRYAIALIDLAEMEKKIDKVEKDFSDLKSMILKSSDLTFFIKSPLVNNADQLAVVESLSKKAKFQPITTKFLGVLIENERLSDLDFIIDSFDAELARRRGQVTVNVKVAQDLTSAQEKSLISTLEKALKATVSLDTSVEPELLGGMVVTAGSVMVDDSVASKLRRLRFAMERSANSNSQNLSEVG